MTKTLVVLGSGPGIGVSTASHFASHGFQRIALLSRNAERLESDASTVRGAASSVEVKTYAVDFADHTSLQSTLKRVELDLGAPEVVLFNAARIAPADLGKEDPEVVLQDFKSMVLALYAAISWAKPQLLSLRVGATTEVKPTFLLTGGLIYKHPVPQLFSLSMQKAAQYNMLLSLRMEMEGRGVHVGTVTIGGQVQDSEPEMNSKNIANEMWKLYEEGAEGKWEVEIGCK